MSRFRSCLKENAACPWILQVFRIGNQLSIGEIVELRIINGGVRDVFVLRTTTAEYPWGWDPVENNTCGTTVVVAEYSIAAKEQITLQPRPVQKHPV